MNKNKYLLLGSSFGVLLLLVMAAVQENFLREWRRVQASARTDEGPIGVYLRQVVNPELRISDRCVSCHVAMAPGEQEVTDGEALAAHKPVVHDPSEYGCTVCHGGQGRATERADAHGDVHFWPEPMVPARFAYAGCGACHTPLSVPNHDLFRRAQLAFERLDCLACHRVDARGGTIRPAGGGMEGPDLSRVGLAGYDSGWYPKHLDKARQSPERAWQTSFAPISSADRDLLYVYLSTRVAAPQLVEAKALFHSTGCLGCHKVNGVGGDDGPDLSRAGEKDPGQLSFSEVPGKATVANWFAEHFRSPAAVVADSQMPIQGLSDEEVELLTFFTLSLRRRELPGAYLPKDRVRAVRFGEREFSSDGPTIFGAFCAGCHGPRGRGWRSPGMAAFPSIANPDFLALVSDEFIAESVRRGRPGRRMPAWGTQEGGLRPQEVQAVVAHVRQLGGADYAPDFRPRLWVAADQSAGRRLFESSCSGCHGPEGEGGEGPALNNQVLLSTATDTYLVETIARGRRGTTMQGFLTPSVVRPALSRPEIELIVAYIRSWEKGKS